MKVDKKMKVDKINNTKKKILICFVVLVIAITNASAQNCQGSGGSSLNIDVWSMNTLLDGSPVPAGTRITVFDVDGVQCGCYDVQASGWYGLMQVYGDDSDAPGDQGANPGEKLTFYINGIPAETLGPDGPIWTTNGATLQIDLAAAILLPGANVFGHVYIAKNQLFVPNAVVTVICDATGNSVAGTSNSKGYYSISIPCPYGTDVTVSATSGPVNICLAPWFCIPYGGGTGSAKGTISDFGYCKVNPALS